MAYLVALKGLNSKQSISLDKDRVVMGRDASCDVVFPANDFAVNREHACILRVQNKFFIEDLGSRNGTFVNNQQVTARQPLKDSDKVRICDFLYSFHETAPVVKPPLPHNDSLDQTIEGAGEPATFEASSSNTSHMLLESQPAERLRAFIDITNNLSKTLELDRVLPNIVETLFQLFPHADRAFVILPDDTGNRLKAQVVRTRRRHDEATARFSRALIDRCLESSQAVLSDDTATDNRLASDAVLAEDHIRSALCAPLRSTNGEVFGVVQLHTQDRGKRFTPEDLNLLVGVAGQISLALENARLHEQLVAHERVVRELELARQVQLSLLPPRLPEVPGYEFFAQCQMAQAVGGDFYEFLPLRQGRLGILVGDAAGMGMPAALISAKVVAEGRYCLETEPDLAAAIDRLNELLYPNLRATDRWVTLCAAVLDPDGHRVALVNAGHCAPLLYRHACGAIEAATPSTRIGVPIGVDEGCCYEAQQLVLEPGDAIAVYSDGVVDALSGQSTCLESHGIREALMAGACSARAMGERMVRAVEGHAAGRRQHDDITVVCFGRNGALS